MKIYLSILIIIISILSVFFIQKKYKLTKQQLSIFLLLTLFWISVGLIRDYRKRYAVIEVSKGGLGLLPIVAANIATGYGLISMLLRFPIFFISDFIQKRKIFIQAAVFLLIITSFSVYFFPNSITLYLSALAIGFAASLLALFNVVFADTFSKENAIISVSILSIAPLLAEFISSAMQYFTLFRGGYYRYLWLSSGIIAVITFILLFFIKEFHITPKQFTKEKTLKILKNKQFLTICLSAILISFIRFSTSGANLNAYVKSLNMDEFLISYIDVVFSISQLIAGVLMGLYIQKKIGIKNTLLVGISCSFIYLLCLFFTQNTTILFYMYIFHGFGYGICYNALISLALQPYQKEERFISMGIFQSFFAIGIFYGDKIYAQLHNLIPNGFLGFDFIRSLYFIVMLIAIFTIFTIQLMIKQPENNA